MKQIVIDTSYGDVYEGPNNYALFPPPYVSVAIFLESDKDPPGPFPLISDLKAEYVFREDSFDATTRIRRGRFYKSTGKIDNIIVQPHPMYGYHGASGPERATGHKERTVHHFESLEKLPKWKLVAIGTENSIWRILEAAYISTGEWLVTLKARSALGILPELDVDKIPEIERNRVVSALDHLVDVTYRETPGSIVEVARNTSALLMAVYAAEQKKDDPEGQKKVLEKDLGEISKHFEQDSSLKKKEIVIAIGKILARLHPRNKHNEQIRHNLQPVTEEDSNFSINAIGLLLNELGWTRQVQ
ncbi:MAG: hypothetical protein ACYCYP_03340 [Leptospirales bacterium]